MLKNIKSEVKKQLKEERVNTATLKRDITIKINKLDEEVKTLFRGYIQGKCDEKMYNELKAEIELEKEKLQKIWTDTLRLTPKPMKSWQISRKLQQMLAFF